MSAAAGSGDAPMQTQLGQVVPVDTTSAPETGTSTWGLRVASGAPDVTVDLGQAVRGHRYAYRAADGSFSLEDDSVTLLDASSVLAAEGLVWAQEGTWAVDAAHDPTLTLALLGKIYPENVVVVPGRTSGPVQSRARGVSAPTGVHVAVHAWWVIRRARLRRASRLDRISATSTRQ